MSVIDKIKKANSDNDIKKILNNIRCSIKFAAVNDFWSKLIFNITFALVSVVVAFGYLFMIIPSEKILNLKEFIPPFMFYFGDKCCDILTPLSTWQISDMPNYLTYIIVALLLIIFVPVVITRLIVMLLCLIIYRRPFNKHWDLASCYTETLSLLNGYHPFSDINAMPAVIADTVILGISVPYVVLNLNTKLEIDELMDFLSLFGWCVASLIGAFILFGLLSVIPKKLSHGKNKVYECNEVEYLEELLAEIDPDKKREIENKRALRDKLIQPSKNAEKINTDETK